MRVDVIGPILGVVLDHENRRLEPRFAVAHGLDQPAERQVVTGHAGRRCERAGPCAQYGLR